MPSSQSFVAGARTWPDHHFLRGQSVKNTCKPKISDCTIKFSEIVKVISTNRSSLGMHRLNSLEHSPQQFCD